MANNTEPVEITTTETVTIGFADNVTVESKYANVVQSLWETVPLVLVTFGTVGNLVTISVLLRPKLRAISSSVYLLSLTITDLLILYFGLFRRWMHYSFKFDIRVQMGCGPHIWLLYTFLGLSSWTLVALTVERFIVVKFPVFSRGGFSRRSAIIVVTALLSVIAAFNSIYIFAYDKSVIKSDSPLNSNTTIVSWTCTRNPEMAWLVDIWLLLDLALTSFAPFLFLVVGNTCIAQEVISRRKQTETSYPNVQKHKPITKLLILLSVMFAVTTLPIRITLCVVPSTSSLWQSDEFKLWWAVSNLIMYTNNTVNFILYCSFGSNFRTELKAMCRELSTSMRKAVSRDTETAPPDWRTVDTTDQPFSFDNIAYEIDEVPVRKTKLMNEPPVVTTPKHIRNA